MYYEIITWPESQTLSFHPEFNEKCHLINDEEGIDQFGSSAYFVPVGFYEAAQKIAEESAVEAL